MKKKDKQPENKQFKIYLNKVTEMMLIKYQNKIIGKYIE